MGDALVSAVANRLVGIAEELIRKEFNLVWGANKEVLNLADKLKTITDVLNDADKKGFTDATTKRWLNRLEETCQEMEDVLDEWDYYVLLQQQMEMCGTDHKVQHSCLPSLPSCLCFKKLSNRRRIAMKIQQVKAKLDQILREEKQFDFVKSQPIDPLDRSWRVPSTSFAKLVDIPSRHHDQKVLLENILSDVGVGLGQSSGLQVISIVGSGGIGKTSLAQLVYNDSEVERRYPLRIWLCVSDPFKAVTIAKKIIKEAGGSPPDSEELDDSVLEVLKNSIQGRKFLLVLDDVWNESYAMWKSLKNCLDEFSGAGSKILVTTRKENVARIMGSVNSSDIRVLGFFTDKDCWSVISHVTDFDSFEISEIERKNFEKTGMEIASKCKGLPLAATVLGSVLLHRAPSLSHWQSVAESEIWKLEQAEVELFPHLALSYNELPLALKRCFSYCAVYPKDHEIDVGELIRNWMALGYLGFDDESGQLDLETKGRDYFNSLAMRSFFHEFERREHANNKQVIVGCKMHDIVHDFAQFLRKKNTTTSSVGAANNKCCDVCSGRPALVSHAKEYRSLWFEDGTPTYICDCLINLRLFPTCSDDFYSRVEIPFPRGVEKLIHLRKLNLSYTKPTMEHLKAICKLYSLKILILRYCCDLREIPDEIGNLSRLRYLDLYCNESLQELPARLCELHELRSLNVSWCYRLSGLPQGTQSLTKLKHFFNRYTFQTEGSFPSEAVGQFTGLHTLEEFRGKLGYLKNLNHLTGRVRLYIEAGEDVVEEARKAELKKKEDIRCLELYFVNSWDWDMEDGGGEIIVEKVLDALEPHQNLYRLDVGDYKGYKLADWITSPLNQIREICLYGLSNLTSIPYLGNLPCLEFLHMEGMDALEYVGLEFVGGLATKQEEEAEEEEDIIESSGSIVRYPMLKTLTLDGWENWKEWEDIPEEEEQLLVFPSLKELVIFNCPRLRALPRRLLRSASSSLETLRIEESGQLFQHYEANKKDLAWDFISNIPHVYVEPS